MIYLGLHDLIYLHFHGHKHQEEIVNTFTVQHLSKEQIKTGSFLKKTPQAFITFLFYELSSLLLSTRSNGIVLFSINETWKSGSLELWGGRQILQLHHVLIQAAYTMVSFQYG